MKVINFFAAPGAGKTSNAQALAGLLSIEGHKVEYVPEAARIATYEQNHSLLTDQILLFAKQHHFLHLYAAQDVDFVIMDSPLPIGLLYVRDNYFQHYEKLIWETFSYYENINFYLPKNPKAPHLLNGRSQDLAQSMALDKKLKTILDNNGIVYTTVSVHPDLPFELKSQILSGI